jgi:mannose-6-phosphate isomerase-like protein (cupin superfamily)
VWGKEEWIVNLGSAGYCGKKLILNKGHQCSIHYHKEKDEVFYINKGIVLMIVDGEELLMKPNSRIRIEPGTKHRFVGLTDSEIIEISSHHKEDDSYRDEPSGKVDEEKFKAYFTKYAEEIKNEP